MLMGKAVGRRQGGHSLHNTWKFCQKKLVNNFTDKIFLNFKSSPCSFGNGGMFVKNKPVKKNPRYWTLFIDLVNCLVPKKGSCV